MDEEALDGRDALFAGSETEGGLAPEGVDGMSGFAFVDGDLEVGDDAGDDGHDVSISEGAGVLVEFFFSQEEIFFLVGLAETFVGKCEEIVRDLIRWDLGSNPAGKGVQDGILIFRIGANVVFGGLGAVGFRNVMFVRVV